jgi:hypothetical protein
MAKCCDPREHRPRGLKWRKRGPKGDWKEAKSK